MKIFIIHGSYGNPDENWFPWLKKELESRGNSVFVPEFPTPKNQNLDNWMNKFNVYLNEIDENTVFIGHSLGPAFILSVLEKLTLSKPVKACFFVSGFLGLLGNQEFDEINKTFTTKDFDWKKIKSSCQKFHVFQSDNDPYVPIERAKELAEGLDAEITVVSGAGHFNEAAGYTKFDLLLEKINKEIS
ncbi:serine hydrolase family protein [Candidatus Pacearchaeota archaeon]|nr:serine hydrolase family protein [Candidatus Pacearchaeota archaeon]MBD3283314.1 serine hydrolase family protein [Candidatus Pacearchaeota archaeon]